MKKERLQSRSHEYDTNHECANPTLPLLMNQLVSGRHGCENPFSSFFLKFLVDTCPILGPLVPLFWISGDVSSGFQSQSGFFLIRFFCGGENDVHSLRSTSSVTPANLLAAGITATYFLTCTSRGGTWLGFEWAITCTEDDHAAIVPVTQLYGSLHGKS